MATTTDTYWETAMPTFLEQWPDALHELSFRSRGFPLTDEQAVALGKANQDYGEVWREAYGDWNDRDAQALERLAGTLDQGIAELGGRAFVKLGSRSAKDSWHDRVAHGGRLSRPLTSAKDALEVMLAASERVHDDLSLCRGHGYPPWLWAREWMEFPLFLEFRAFVRDGRLIGISQYEYRTWFYALAGEDDGKATAIASDCRDAIDGFVRERLAPALAGRPSRSVVADVVVRQAHAYGVTLVELNPFFRLTDPCLFSWDELESPEWGAVGYVDFRVVRSAEEATR